MSSAITRFSDMLWDKALPPLGNIITNNLIQIAEQHFYKTTHGCGKSKGIEKRWNLATPFPRGDVRCLIHSAEKRHLLNHQPTPAPIGPDAVLRTQNR